jgi:Lrp/AsnC family transcriptional regulator for asnA, asnC and gidA
MPQPSQSQTPIRIDNVDQLLIEQLQTDGRMPYTKLASAVGLSEAAARQRVQRLIDTGVIQVVAVTNPLMVGRKRVAMIGVRTTGETSEVADALRQLDVIEYLVITAGSYDFLAEVVVRDEGELLAATNAIRATPGVVTTETFVYLELVKQTFTWGVH